MEVEGNNKKIENLIGTTRSEIFQKGTAKGTYSMIWVEDNETGELREVFANTVKFTK